MESARKVLKKLEKLCFAMICILMADCCLFGAGRFIEIGSLGFRMVLLAVVLVMAIPSMLMKWKTLLKNRFAQLVLFFLAWLIFSAVWGVVADNSRTHIISDLKGFAYLAFLPVALSVLTTKERLITLMKVMMYSCAALAVVGVVSLVAYVWFPTTLFQAIFNLFAAKDGNSYGVVAYTAISDKILRVFFYSGLYLICGCAFSIYYQVTSRGRFRWHYALITGLCLFTLLLTFTRSVYLAVFIAAAFVLAVFFIKSTKAERKKLFAQISVGVLLVLVLLVIFGVSTGSNYFRYALSRVAVTFADDTQEPPSESVVPTESTDELATTEPIVTEPIDKPSEGDSYNAATLASDELRAMTVVEMKENIKKSPIIGNGLGVALKCRDDGYGEYFYLDMISKTGVVGLLLYMAPLIYMLVLLLADRSMEKKNKQLAGVWVSSLLGFCTYSYFNPYMNAALGVLYYCCTIGVFHFCKTCDV